MDTWSSSEAPTALPTRTSQPSLGSLPLSTEPFVPVRDRSLQEFGSWAQRSGFVSEFSGEVYREAAKTEKLDSGLDLEKGIDLKHGSPLFEIETNPISGRTKNQGIEIGMKTESVHEIRKGEANDALASGDGQGAEVNQGRNASESVLTKDGDMNSGMNRSGNGIGRDVARIMPATDPKVGSGAVDTGVEANLNPSSEGPHGVWPGSSALKCGLRENPGIGLLIYYCLQHYVSLVGSLIFIPLIVVPAMGGTDKDTATVISTMLLVTGITTIMHSFFGTRLPLVQGSSFVFLAPTLVIINSRDYRNLTENKFKHIMRELQGAIIVGSIFQTIMGFCGLMFLISRVIKPIVVASTVAAVGLAFFNYGFPQAGTCLEISIPQIVLVLLFTLYLHGISIFGQRLFQIYAVPLSIVITWTYAFFLTAGGAYSYSGCNPEIPSSNILTDACRRHVYTMKHCQTDVSSAWRTVDWIRIPYPFQWGIPIFHLRTSIIMIVTSIVATVESVGTYHCTSLQVDLNAPTPGTVSRGIGLEGFCSILAGLWGTTTGSTTLMENVYTIYITKVASRRMIRVGAVFLIFISFIGKIGAVIASMPLALVASVLCFEWALLVVLGLSALQCGRTASSRSIIIAGVSLFLGLSIPALGLSIPAYFQQYQPLSTQMLPSYFIPYSAAADGPIRFGSDQIDFGLNALLSMSMVVTLLLAIVLDNTVPGKHHERDGYAWLSPGHVVEDPTSITEDYSPPRRAA